MIGRIKYLHACVVPNNVKVPIGVGGLRYKWKCPECHQKWEISRYAHGFGFSMRIGIRRYLKGFK